MPEITSNVDRNRATIRTPVLTFEIIRWDWNSGKRRDGQPINITPAVMNFQWQKTIKSPQGGASLTLIPQIGGTHFLDFLNPMDVVQIKEFGVLKFQGFIRSVQSTGKIDKSSGKPTRLVSLRVMGFGNLYVEGSLGLNLYIKLEKYDIAATMEQFAAKLADAVIKEQSFASVVGTIIDEWYGYLRELGATKYVNYLNTFIDYQTGLAGKRVPGYPRQLRLFQAESEQQTIWNILNRVVEPPFNEVWFDNGPRSVYYEQNENLSPAKPTQVNLDREKTYLIIRATPFNGTVINGNERAAWDSLPAKTVPLGYLTQFNLNKTMDESYSFYLVEPSIMDMKNLELVAMGSEAFDTEAFEKYLYRPLVKQQFYTRDFEEGETAAAANYQDIFQVSKDGAETLRNWYELNDQYLSGNFTINVPSDAAVDPMIGDKIAFEGLDDAYFYCEGVGHSWTYGGSLTSNLSVTRGYGLQKPIELQDRIFKRGIFAMNRQFNET